MTYLFHLNDIPLIQGMFVLPLLLTASSHSIIESGCVHFAAINGNGDA